MDVRVKNLIVINFLEFIEASLCERGQSPVWTCLICSVQSVWMKIDIRI